MRDAPAYTRLVSNERDGRQTVSDARPFLPQARDIPSLQAAARDCRGCELYANATQTVFGEGPGGAIMLVGEQPGDQEDRQGKPFVGPAGGVLDRALVAADIDREHAYLTNAVKHFKWVPRGKRRIHETPRASEIRACLPWLEAEIEAVAPSVIVILGATAVRALLGPSARVLSNRGRVTETAYGPCLVTVHPSSVLRVEDESQRQAAFDAFVSDLRQAVTFAVTAGSMRRAG